MKKVAGQRTGRWLGMSVAVTLAGAGLVVLRHILETPQPLKSTLPGEAHLYRWQQHSIFYKVLGAADAPPLVLLHRPDIGSSGHEMQALMALLARYYRVYTPDLLGFGLSDRPAGEYSAEIYSKLCQDFLREVVGKPAILVASGLSCNYVILAATATPTLCASLVLISPFKLRGDSRPVLNFLVEQSLIRTLLYPFLCTRLAFLLIHRLEGRDDFRLFSANTHQLGAEYAAMARVAGKLDEDVERQFERLPQPVLILWGMHALNKRALVARLHQIALLAHPTGASRKVEFIRQAALTPHKDQPADVVAVIKRWQDEIPAEHTPATDSVLATGEISVVSASSEGSRSATPTIAPAPAPPPAALNHLTTHSSLSDAKGLPAEEFTEILAYCVRCKEKRPMLQAHEVFMKNGRPALQGVCAVCGTRLNRIGSKK